MIRKRYRWRVAAPFDLRLALFGHGWVDLAPHSWSEDRGRWVRPLATDERFEDSVQSLAAASH